MPTGTRDPVGPPSLAPAQATEDVARAPAATAVRARSDPRRSGVAEAARRSRRQDGTACCPILRRSRREAAMPGLRAAHAGGFARGLCRSPPPRLAFAERSLPRERYHAARLRAASTPVTVFR